MNMAKSTWGIIALGICAVLLVGFGFTRKIMARHKTEALAQATPAAPTAAQNDDTREAEALGAVKDTQRKPRSEDKEDGVKRARYAPPDRERVRSGGSDTKEPPPPPYVPMRLRPAREAKAANAADSKPSALAPPVEKLSAVSTKDIQEETKHGKPDLSRGFAPYGRLLKCELLLTLESTNEQTPIVGLVTNDLYWNGKLIIPANSEVHGRAKIDRVRDRAFSENRWVVVLSEDKQRVDGTELELNAIALDREDVEGSGKTWGITDGSYGLKGDVIRTDDLKTVEAFAAAAIAASASSLQQTHQTLLGDTMKATPRNAALAGTAEVMRQLQKDILDEIQRNGSYLRVPAGKQFYLYIQETVFPGDAKIAATMK